MPYDDPDPSDPMMLTGVACEGGRTTAAEAVCAFAEEFARSGHGVKSIMDLFQSPEYLGLHGAYCALGHGSVAAIVAECVEAFEACRAAARTARPKIQHHEGESNG